MSQQFAHLHLHSQYSLLDGAIKVKPLLERCQKYDMPAVAITDHGNMFGAVEFFKAAKGTGVKPIIGSEVYVAPGSRFDKTNARGSSEASYHLILLAQNKVGYKNLCRLLTLAHKEGFYYKPRVDWELLAKYNEGLIAMSACLGGEVPQLILQDNLVCAKQRTIEMAEIFRDRFYLELQENHLAEQEQVNRELIKFSSELDLPLVATNDCHYLTKEDAFAHEVLLCVQTGKNMDDPSRMRFPNNEFYVKTPEEMISLFADYPEAIANTIKIAEQCDVSLEMEQYYLPDYEKPEEKTLAQEMADQAHAGLNERFEEIQVLNPDLSEADKAAYRERLDEEIKIIDEMGFPGYLLIVADFINWAKDQNIPVGPGRGSAAGSLVCYSLKITDIDPIPYNLLFERFLNPERVSMPDIDVDFCIRGREEVINYVREKYGQDNVAQIITFGTMAAKGAVRDVCRAMNVAYGDADKISKMIPDTAGNLNEALEIEPKLKKLIDSDEKVARVFKIAIALEGLTRHASTHAAGVVVTPDALTEYCPLYVDQKTGAQVTAYNMKYAEEIGLVKFDFLGLKNLTVIDNAIRYIHRDNPDFDLRKISFSDEKAFDLLQAGNTTGVFQLESSGMKDLLKRLKPTCFEDIIAVCALYRPGPLGSGMVDDFIKRKHGVNAITYDFPQLEPILKDTYGVIVYQEQVMQMAQVLANYTLGGADLLRRAMGKKKPEEMAKQKKIFLEGAKENKLDLDKADAVFELIQKFADYGFNKSHSAAYAMIAYQTAYLKAHYPVEFMAALLTEDMENTDKVMKNITEVRSMGIEVLPPDINESDRSFTVHGNVIRFGLGAVKGVGANAIDAIIVGRKEGRFVSLHDFCERVELRKVNKKVIEALIKCGAMDSFGRRAQLSVGMETAIEIGQKIQKEQESGQTSLFGTEEVVSTRDKSINYGTLPDIEEWPEKDRLTYEKEALGFYISGHPLERHVAAIRRFAHCELADIASVASQKNIRVCGTVAHIREITTKRGDRMAFVGLEDLTGKVEIVVFTNVYNQYSELIKSDVPLCVVGTPEKQEDTVKMVANEFKALTDIAEELTQSVRFHIDTEGAAAKKCLQDLRDVVARHRGTCEAFVHLNVSGKTETILQFPEEIRVAASDELVAEAEKLFGANSVRFE